MDESKLELKVGALLLAALLGSLGLLSLMGELSFGSDAGLKVDWGHTGNVVKGAPVKIAGVSIGRVESINLLATRRDPQGERCSRNRGSLCRRETDRGHGGPRSIGVE